MRDPGRVRAPQFPTDPSLWLNTGGQSVSLTSGTVYLLDFWTMGCINCMHVLPDLAYLEEKYRDRPFVVIGVHSGKFDHEKGEQPIRQAILRYGIHHPVLRDDDFTVWRQYAVRAWPTQILIDAAGYIVGVASGEGHRAALEESIDALLAGSTGDSVPVRFTPGTELDDLPLRFPGKVLADASGNRLFIADSGHHRVVVASLDGSTTKYAYIGEGDPGLVDGPPETARFRSPQGMALSPDGSLLYVADTGNHALRRIDLSTGTVTTLAGNGQQALGPLREVDGIITELNSPWDLVLAPDGNTLLVAMAGSHQIAAVELDSGKVRIYAGNGQEARRDGPADQAMFAQPSGLTRDDKQLYIADAESSSIRAINLSDTAVETLAGGDLFTFGHQDGRGEAARFQHPLGIVYHEGMLYVADTYNHCLRRVNPTNGETITLTPPGDTTTLYEPGGLSAAGDALYIADTNTHRIRVFRRETKSMTTLPLPGLCSPTLCFPAMPDREGVTR